MKKMTPERFNLICDTLYGMVRRVQDMTDEKVKFEVNKYESSEKETYLWVDITVWRERTSDCKYYHISQYLVDSAEKEFEEAKKCLNDILSKASVQFEEIEEVEE